ncbi:uncharacterized protein LOC134269423 [Saccostrea cucullata]|uniref:uncharacterized protein LOC134269423 n=1 Tax=Saccostrea cuccullata TaxID=36930 RepID=UPI002ED2B315
MARPILIKSSKNKGTRKKKSQRFDRSNDAASIDEEEDENNAYVVTKLSSFRHGSGTIPTLCPLSEDCWIHKFGSKYNELMTEDGEEIRSSYFGFLVNHMTSVGNGEMLMSDYYNMKLKMLTKSGEIIDIAETEPLHPFGVCATVDGDFIVCLVDNDDCVMSEKSQRVIARINRDGERMQTIKSPISKEDRLFTKPYRVSENRNLDILIVDWTSDRTSRLVVLTKTGQLKCVCKGKPRRFGEMPFNPSDVCCNSESFVLVSDLSSHTVQLLNPEYKFVQNILAPKDGIEYPLALALSHDNVWVGSGNGKVTLLKLTKKKQPEMNGHLDVETKKSKLCIIS